MPSNKAGSQSLSSSFDGPLGIAPASVSSLKPEEFAALLLAEQAEAVPGWPHESLVDDDSKERTKGIPDIADAVAALCEKEERVKQEAAEIERLKVVLASLEVKEQALARKVAGEGEDEAKAEGEVETKAVPQVDGDGLSPFDDQELELWELRHEVGRLNDRESQLAAEVERLRDREEELAGTHSH